MFGVVTRGALVACCSIAIPASAFAASQGTLGSTSTGSVGISATIPARAQISGLTDIGFGTVDPASAASQTEDVCVWSNTPGRGYQITATGSGSSNAFTLSDGTNTLPYSVEWAATASQLS